MKPKKGEERYVRLLPRSPAYGLAFGRYWRDLHSDWIYKDFDAIKGVIESVFGAMTPMNPVEWRNRFAVPVVDSKRKAHRGVPTSLPPRNPKMGQRVYTTASCGHDVSVFIRMYDFRKNLFEKRKAIVSSRKCVGCLMAEWMEEERGKFVQKGIL